MDNRGWRRVLGYLIFLAIIAIALAYTSPALDALQKAGVIIVLLSSIGYAVQKVKDLKGGYGLYLLGTKKGLKKIDEISQNHAEFWNAMALWGLTLGFGVLTYPLLKGRISKRIYLFGIVSIILIIFFVVPYFQNAIQFINIPQIQNAVSGRPAPAGTANLFPYLITAITIIAGFSGFIFISIVGNAASIILCIYTACGLQNQVPGIAPVIPGITIPLFAGIISLAIILVVHEFSHGILSRIAKVKLKSIGVVIFGLIPIGAYVEPDERMINKLDRMKQTKIFSAGIAANFIATIFFFALILLLIYYVIPGAYSYGVVISGTRSGYPAANVLQPGMQLLQYNGYTIRNISDLVSIGPTRPNSTITVVTNTGTYMFRTVPDPSNSTRGIIGIGLLYEPIINTTYGQIVYFMYTLFALSMLLNFLVGAVNLLPLPGFDGWRIYKANIKSEKLINAIAALAVLGLVINVLPWFSYI